MQFASRPTKEVVLRGVVRSLFQHDWLSREASIIDIGAWIGDNALVWAQELSSSASVIAIDPSEMNVEFIRTLADLNRIDNVHTVIAACSDSVGERMFYQGSLEHTGFLATTQSDSFVESTSIDEIWVAVGCPPVELLHLDVEGLELRVAMGAEETLRRHRPVVLFEHHLRDDEGLRALLRFFGERSYTVSMINEVLPGCDLDCRNFLAAPDERGIPSEVLNQDPWLLTVGGFRAVPGTFLVPVS